MQEAQYQEYGVSRLLAFSDGVFAFAITLLVTTLSFPDLTRSPSDGQIVHLILSRLPNFYSYVFSFYMVAVYWVAHHRTFRYIIRFDNRLLWINVTLLLFIAFLPFPTSLVGRYGNSSVITAFYAVTLSMVSLLTILLWRYASSSHRLIPQDLDQKIITYLSLRGIITFAVFFISIGLSFINPGLARVSWLATFFIRPIFLRKYVRDYEWL